jgi:hypothetical protein
LDQLDQTNAELWNNRFCQTLSGQKHSIKSTCHDLMPHSTSHTQSVAEYEVSSNYLLFVFIHFGDFYSLSNRKRIRMEKKNLQRKLGKKRKKMFIPTIHSTGIWLWEYIW